MYNEHKYIDELRIEKVAGEDLFIYEESFEDSLFIDDNCIFSRLTCQKNQQVIF